MKTMIVVACLVTLLSACTTTDTHTLTSMCQSTKHQKICSKVDAEGQVDLIVNLSSELTDSGKRSQLVSILKSLGFQITSQLETLPVIGLTAFRENWYLLSEIKGIESFSLSGTVDAFPGEGDESF